MLNKAQRITRTIPDNGTTLLFHFTKTMVLALALFGFSSVAQAALVGQIESIGGICGGDLNNWGTCKAGEISISEVVDLEFEGDITECVLGQPLTITSATVNYDMGTQARSDLILWIGDQQGVDPRAAAGPEQSCSAYSLPEPFGNPPSVANPFGDVDGDECGDIAVSVPAASRTFSNISLLCQDNNGDGKADAQIMLAWAVANDSQACGTGPGQTFPVAGNAPSKCDYQNLETVLDAVFAPRLTLVKAVTNNNGGLRLPTAWTLSADGPGGSDISGVTGTPAVTDAEVDEGAYTLGESGPNGYVGTWQCTGGGTLLNGVVTLSNANPAQETTCTLTNDDVPATLTLQKTVNGGNAADTAWTLIATGPTTIQGVEGAAAVTNALVSAGQYTLTEINGPSGYTQVGWQCTGGSLAVNVLTLPLGDTATCTVTNDAQATSLTLTKIVNNPNGGNAVVGDWTLSADAINFTSGVPQDVSPDTYTLSESGPGGYSASAWQCTGTGDFSGLPDITLTAGQSASCTITNTDVAPGLTLIKSVNDSFGGNDLPGSFELQLNGTPYASGATPPVMSNTPYTASEPNPNAGYTLTSIICLDDGSGARVDDNGAFQLNEGQNVTCTYTNQDEVPTLTVVKEVINLEGTLGPGDFQLLVNGCGLVNEPVDSGNTATPIASNCVLTVSEDTPLPANYTQTGLVCVDTGNGNAPVAHPVTLNEGQDVTCTITNSEVLSGSITVTKSVINLNGGGLAAGDFSLNLVGDGDCNAPGDITSGYNLSNPVDGCTYTLTEPVVPTGYTNTSIVCTEQTNGADDGVFTFASGETWSCVVENDDVAPLLTLQKTVDNTAGGTAVDTDWTLEANGPTPISGVDGNVAVTNAAVNAGDYTLSERDGPLGYSASPWVCVASPSGATVPSAPLNLAVGDDVTCTITNTAAAATLTLNKVVVNDSGGAELAGAWTLSAGGTEQDQGVATSVNAGTYALTESGPDGYAAAAAWDCSGGDGTFTPPNQIELANGDTAVCSITNDDIAPALTLEKEVINNNGGSAVPGSFTLTLQGDDGTHNTAQNYSTGQMPAVKADVLYTMDELMDVAGYENTGVVCVNNGDGDDPVVTNGTFTLGLADDVTCTLTNDDAAPTLVLNKTVINDSGGDLAADAFDLILTGNDTTHDAGVAYQSGATPVIEAGVQYEVSETPPEGYALESISCVVLVDDGPDTALPNPFTPLLGQDISCTVTNDDVDPVARFLVTKNFSDGNQGEIEVGITCNTGLPLAQTFMISEGDPVNFVVESFEPGTMDCRVEEYGANDEYSKTFLAGDADGIAESIDDDDTACYFNGIQSGQFTCEITNIAKPATFTVYKDWVIENDDGDFIDLLVDVTISCESEIFEDDADQIDGDLWQLSGEIGDGGSLKATVDTTTSPARCRAEESVIQSGVESVDDCGWRNIPAGSSDDCTFTNTVFFEGIPTLNQYGLIMLALLMLGVGAVGFRRFV